MSIVKKKKRGKLKLKKKLQFSKKRFLISCLLFFLSFNLIVSSFSTVAEADANDRISTFITLASGKQTTNLKLNDLNLSEKDLQFLGVYISNFFVPFGTELGTNDDVTSMNKEDIKTALQTNLNFSDALAESLTETLLGLSRASINELSLYVSKEYQGDLVEVKNMPLNYYTALSCMFGGLNKLVAKYGDKDDVLKGIASGEYQYGYFAYSKGGKTIPVFDFDIDLSSITASTASFIKAMESVDIESGYGFNFFDFTKAEMGTSEGDYADKVDSLTEDQIYKMSIYGSRLSVDCFGNIIIMGGNHQFIAVPGAMNPYTWVTVDDNGTAIGKGLGGTAYNVANIPSMALQNNAQTGNTLFSNVTGNDGDVKNGVLDVKVIADKLGKLWSSNGTFSLRKVRGSNDADLGSGVLDWVGKGSDFRELAKMAEQGYITANPNAKNYFGIKDGLFSIDTKYVGVYAKPVSSLTDTAVRNIDILDSLVYTDNLGAAHFDDGGESIEFKAFNVASYISNSDTLASLRESMSKWGSSADNGFTNTYNSIENGDMIIPSGVSKEAMVGLYVTYAWSSLYDSTSAEAKKATIGALGYKMNSDALPAIPDSPLSLSNGAMADLMLTSIRDWVYYLLHPTEGLDYFKTWLSNKLNSFLVSWHEDMVGTSGTGSVNGTTVYRGTSGYVTTPELSDIPWTDSLISLYRNSIPFLLVAMIIVMLGAYVVGILSFQKSVIGFLIFCITAQLPIAFINGVVGTSNRFSSNLYGEKFTYWALVQHESYSDAIDEAASGSDYSNYLKTLYEKNSQATGNQGQESIMLKWQAPKKMSSLMLTKNDTSALSGFGSSKLLSGLINATYSGESYLDEDSVYLYRSYIDISNFSRYIHRGLSGSNPKQPVNLSLTSDIKSTWSDSLKDAINDYSSKYESDRALGYANKNGDGSSDGTNNSILRVRLPLSSSIVTEAYGKGGNLENMTLDDYVGINQDAFNFSIPMFNVGSSGMDFKEVLKTDNFDASKYSSEDFSGLAAYGLMSENPFYYFSWYLYESGLSHESSSTEGYKNLLLGEDNAGFFYNTKGNGELKDFMDMRSLFTYIIPYLKQGNDLVQEWDDTYGIFIYEGVPTEEGHQNDADIKNNPELRQKYWHNLNVSRLYNIYTPWVDVMYDCSYAKPEKISFLGDTYVIEDPINPASYPDERPMIFSKSEMVDYGLKENQLTKVERLIIKAQEGMQERMFNLLNYYSFNDVVLNTASAMNCAFEFNTTFSENGLFGTNHNIYPQAFELNDFSYDAFLRFILASSTGESMIVDKDGSFYSNLVSKSSTTTIIVMLLLDIISVYVVPGLKIFFIMGMFIMSILIILMSAFKVDPQYKFVKRLGKSFISPMIRFLIINCGMAFILSLFMGEGSTAVTGSSKPTIVLGDPVMVMLAMILLNGIVLYLFFKMLKDVWKDIRSSGKLVGNFLTGVAGSVGGLALATAVGSASRNLRNTASKFGGGYSDNGDSPSPRAKNRNSVTYVERSGNSEIRKTAYSNRSIKKLEKEYKKASLNRKSSPSTIDSKTKAGLNKIKRNSKRGK